MEFCKKCGSLIIINKGKVACAKCNYKPENKLQLETSEKIINHNQVAVVNERGGEEIDEEEDYILPEKVSNKNEELIEFDGELKIIESFSDEDEKIIQKVKRKEFEPIEKLNLRIKSEEVSKETEIEELISYNLIRKNLEYDLPHQQDGALKILRDMDGRVLLADEVGLGKTITAGMVLKECVVRGFVKKALILTPSSLVEQWIDELKTKFELDFKHVKYEYEWENTDFAIASIDTVKSFDNKTNNFKHSKVHENTWDILIVDEAHKLKNRDSIRWKFVDKIKKKRILLLTATPFQNDLYELYNLLHLLRRGHLGTQSEFKKKFLRKGNKRHPLNPKELKKKLNEVMIRRRRDETKIDYKERVPKIISVNLTERESKIYEKIIDLLLDNYSNFKGNPINARLLLYSLLPKITSSSKSSIETLRKIIENPKYHKDTKDMAREILEEYKLSKYDTKIEVLLNLIQKILKEDKQSKILIYTKHPTTLKYIASKLNLLKISHAEYQGGLTTEEKTNKIIQFKEKAQVMISTDTGAEGLNLQFCSNLINYDLPWNPMSVEQRIGRLDRIGQKKKVKVYSLATRKTMEEHIVDLIINKMCCIGLVIGELPIILINMGLDSAEITGKKEENKFADKLMNAFIDSKDNLDKFAGEVSKIGSEIEKGISEYDITKKVNSDLLD